MDVLIVDCMHIAPLSAESHFKVFPAEAVVGALEITSAPKASVTRSGVVAKISKMQDDLLKLGRVRNIARDRQYLDSIPVMMRDGSVALEDRVINYSLSPRSFLITCGDEWKKHETYERNLMSAMTAAQAIERHSWVNGVFSMRHGLFHFHPYTNNEHTRIPQDDNALLEFMMFLSRAVSDFRTSRIDVSRYRPTLPREAERREGASQ